MPTFPSVSNLGLGVSPELLNLYWQQFGFTGFPNSSVNGVIASDVSVAVQLTSAQLLALNTTAVQLVAPPVTSGGTISVPPRGFLYVPTTLTLEYLFGGTAYTIGGTSPVIQIEYTGKAVNLLSVSPTGLVDQAVNTQTTNLAAGTGPVAALANSANLGLEVKLGGTTPTLTLGNGTVNLYMLYNVYALL
jgi:hypothetical protein